MQPPPRPYCFRNARRALCAAIACASLGIAASATRAQPVVDPPLAGPALAAALGRGGLTLYFRHVATDFSQNDERFVAGDCSTQRNLTDAGRADARAIGREIRRLKLPVGEVLASPYCRTMETAELIFGRATASPAVRGGPAQAPAERYAELRKLFATSPAPGTVRAIASHGNPFRAVTDSAYLAEGEAAVVAPDGDGFRIVARIRKDEWSSLRAR
jgi:hypothetical protein